MDRQGCGGERATSYCVNCTAVRRFYDGAAGSDDLFIVYASWLCVDMSDMFWRSCLTHLSLSSPSLGLFSAASEANASAI